MSVKWIDTKNYPNAWNTWSPSKGYMQPYQKEVLKAVELMKTITDDATLDVEQESGWGDETKLAARVVEFIHHSEPVDLTFTISKFVTMSRWTDKGWRSVKLMPGSSVTLEKVKIGSRGLIMGFDCTDSTLGQFYGECSLAKAEEYIDGFADILMMGLDLTITLSHFMKKIEQGNKAKVKAETKAKTIETAERRSQQELWGSW